MTTKQPVIVNASLQSRGICRRFEQKHVFNVRVSASTLSDTCIFPKSSVAFLLLDQSELERSDEETFNRILKFSRMHGNSHTLCIQSGGILDHRIFGLFSTIQLRLLMSSSSSCYFNMVASEEAATDTMINVAKLHSGVIDQSLVQEMDKMQESLVSEDAIKAVLSSLPMTSQENTMVLDRCGSLGKLATASEELLLDGGLDKQTARKVHEFFKTDTYHM